MILSAPLPGPGPHRLAPAERRNELSEPGNRAQRSKKERLLIRAQFSRVIRSPSPRTLRTLSPKCTAFSVEPGRGRPFGGMIAVMPQTFRARRFCQGRHRSVCPESIRPGNDAFASGPIVTSKMRAGSNSRCYRDN